MITGQQRFDCRGKEWVTYEESLELVEPQDGSRQVSLHPHVAVDLGSAGTQELPVRKYRHECFAKQPGLARGRGPDDEHESAAAPAAVDPVPDVRVDIATNV